MSSYNSDNIKKYIEVAGKVHVSQQNIFKKIEEEIGNDCSNMYLFAGSPAGDIC